MLAAAELASFMDAAANKRESLGIAFLAQSFEDLASVVSCDGVDASGSNTSASHVPRRTFFFESIVQTQSTVVNGCPYLTVLRDDFAVFSNDSNVFVISHTESFCHCERD